MVAVAPSKLHLQKLHGPVQQAVNHLKARVLVVVNGRQAPAVPGAHIWFVEANNETGLNHTTLIKVNFPHYSIEKVTFGLILQHHVGYLKEFERKRHLPVGSNSLQQAGQ